MRIHPFQGLVPPPARAPEVACVPYDVVDAAEAAALAAGRSGSLLHVDRAEINLPAGTNPYSDAVYAKARENFLGLQQSGCLIPESGPCLYLYQLRMGEHVQRGIVAACAVEDYEQDRIKRHEKTRQDKEDDRSRLIDTLDAQTGPVLLAYRDTPAIANLVGRLVSEVPQHDFTAPDGIRHTLWRIPGGEEWVKVFAEVPAAYIADGHHRVASAARVARQRRERNPGHTGDEEYNWFLAVLFPAGELKILPYNRIVADLNGIEPADFLTRVREHFRLDEEAPDAPEAPGRISMYFQGRWYGLRCTADPSADPVGRLDVSLLQERLLAPVLGIADVRTSKRIDFVGGIRGPGELVRRVDATGGVAFSMYPVSLDQLMAIADAGQIMPPKSTWFEPKLRSGLFVHTF